MNFNFILSGYNNDYYSLRLYNYNDIKLTLLDIQILNNPSYCITYKNTVFTFSLNPLCVIAYQIIDNKFVLLDKMQLPFQGLDHLFYSHKNNLLLGASYYDGVMCKIDFVNNKFNNLVYIDHKKLYGSISKCHCIITNKQEDKILCVNIDTSCLYIYDVNFNLLKTIKLHSGCGPRHAIWDNDFIYVVTEYSNEIIVIKNYEPIQYISTLTKDIKSYGGTLFKTNGYLYASNRGEETIAKFKILKDKTLKYISSFPVNGIHSRHMIYYKNLIISLNKNSNNVSFIDFKSEKELTNLYFPNVSGIDIVE